MCGWRLAALLASWSDSQLGCSFARYLHHRWRLLARGLQPRHPPRSWPSLRTVRRSSRADLEAARQARDEEELQRSEQRAADRVVCDAYSTSKRLVGGTRVAAAIEVVVANHTGSVLRKVQCQVHLGGIGSVDLIDAFGPDERDCRRTLEAPEPIKVSVDDHEVHESVVFTFLLDGLWWSRRPADTQAVRMQNSLA
jgi:hypothetical protein